MRVLVVFGTRPEAIKMAPIIHALRARSGIELATCVTAQHREMLDQVLNIFAISPDYDLDLMRSNQSLTEITAKVLEGVGQVIEEFRPDRVLVQGDTTTAFAAALSAFYHRIPVGHVEAGLRTGQLYSPWPEEANRRLAAVVTNQHFAPTPLARDNLFREGHDPNTVYLTGNTVIDALMFTRQRIRDDHALASHVARPLKSVNPEEPVLLVTLHRRENHGPRLRDICEALVRLAANRKLQVLFPVHPNPNVQTIVREMLFGIQGIHLLQPLDYPTFIHAMDRAAIIVTDSGGVQEEAPSLNVPVLVARDTTERPEGIEAGTSLLVGPNGKAIEAAVERLLDDSSAYTEMTGRPNPYGDGRAAQYIADILTLN